MKQPLIHLIFATFIMASPLHAQTAGPENTATDCQDGADNDGDGYSDCQDQECSAFTFCPQASGGAGCMNDMDCKGNRVCENGQCVVSGPMATAGHVQTGRGLVVTGIVLSMLGVASGSASLGLATQSTNSDTMLFASIGTGAFGWLFSVVGGGLQLGGQAKAWNAVLQLGGKSSRGLFIGGIVTYSLMSLTGAAAMVLGPTVGTATGIGSAPFFGPLLVTEVLATTILLAGDWRVNRALESVLGTASVSPFFTPLETGGAVAGFAGTF